MCEFLRPGGSNGQAFHTSMCNFGDASAEDLSVTYPIFKQKADTETAKRMAPGRFSLPLWNLQIGKIREMPLGIWLLIYTRARRVAKTKRDE